MKNGFAKTQHQFRFVHSYIFVNIYQMIHSYQWIIRNWVAPRFSLCGIVRLTVARPFIILWKFSTGKVCMPNVDTGGPLTIRMIYYNHYSYILWERFRQFFRIFSSRHQAIWIIRCRRALLEAHWWSFTTFVLVKLLQYNEIRACFLHDL